MPKVTYTLDDETVSYLNRTAERLGLPKSRVVREAIRIYGEQAGRLSTEERLIYRACRWQFNRLEWRVPKR